MILYTGIDSLVPSMSLNFKFFLWVLPINKFVPCSALFYYLKKTNAFSFILNFLLLINSDTIVDLLRCCLWNLLILSLTFSKSIYSCYASDIFYSFQFFIYVALYFTLYLFVFQQSTISSISYSSYMWLLLSKISIGGFDDKTWFENVLSDAKYSFCKWKIDVRLVSFIC